MEHESIRSTEARRGKTMCVRASARVSLPHWFFAAKDMRRPPPWPRRGRTTIATGDQREPVVTDGNVPVPEGGECSGKYRKGQSGDWRAQESPPARPNVDAASCRVLCSTMVRAKADSNANTPSSPCPLVLWLRGQDAGGKRLEASSTLGMPHALAQESPPARSNVDAASCRVLCSTLVRAEAENKANTSSSPCPLVLWLRVRDTGRKRLEASSTLGMPHALAREFPPARPNVDAASCRVLCSTMARAKAISKANTSSSPYPLVLWLRGQDTERKRLEASSTLGMPHVTARERSCA
jgi:hypothetical protein